MTRKKSEPAARQRKTLERVLSRAGLCSRATALDLIANGRVRVNGRVVREDVLWIDPERDDVRVDEKPLRAAKKLYLALHKPKGYLTSFGDPRGRKTVYDLLEGIDTWVFPVGRLDRDTSGLLLLTNDSDFQERVSNPDSRVEKVYRAETSSRLGDEQLEALRAGVMLSDGPARPTRVKRLRDFTNRTVLELALTEGRNREVRRLLQAVGSRVRELRRTEIGPVTLGDLASGRLRALTREELQALGVARDPIRSAAAGRSHRDVRLGRTKLR